VYTDKTLACRDCGASFVFTSGEQDFYASRGFTNEPSRCPECRSARKQGARAGGFGGERQMFSVVCADCGKQTEVPFQPRLDRPVYCSDCFEAHRPAATSRGGAGGGRGRY